MVLVRDEGDGVARVELDYVTPRFRDFSPGSSSIGAAGCSAITAFERWSRRRGWLAPYHGRLGMRRDGESYVRDVG